MLIEYFQAIYSITFGGLDDSQDLRDGLDMLDRWYDRTDFSTFTVISAEQKLNFPLKTSIGDVPFNYIWDRFDQLEDDVYRVVDYKTNRWGFRPEDLKKKTQARAYAVAAQIAYPQAKEIWVQFDLLRHDSVGTRFTRDENIATWKKLRAVAEIIISTPEGQAPYTLNGECIFCPIKASCPEILRNVAVGGIFGKTIEQLIDWRAEIGAQQKASEAAIKEIDDLLLKEAQERDLEEFETDEHRLTFSVSKQRKIDGDMVSRVIGEEMFEQYGAKRLTMADYDRLLKDPRITPAQRGQLKRLVTLNFGEPHVKVEDRGFVDDRE
jgi:PD-(D/E)XK nuclease superfamily